MHKDLEKFCVTVSYWDYSGKYYRPSFIKVALHKEFIKLGWDKYSKKIFEEFLLTDFENEFVKNKIGTEKHYKKLLRKIIHD